MLLLLSRYGTTVRIGPKETSDLYDPSIQTKDYKMADIRHPAVLQPVAAFDWEHLRVEILPGIKVKYDPAAVKSLESLLAEDGYIFADPRPYNIGFLNMKTDKYPGGLPVVLDRNSVRRVEEKPRSREDDYDYAQKHLWQLLAKKFEEASARNDMQPFWDHCASFTNKGESSLLFASWEDPLFSDPTISHYAIESEPARAQRVARRYEQQLADYVSKIPPKEAQRAVE